MKKHWLDEEMTQSEWDDLYPAPTLFDKIVAFEVIVFGILTIIIKCL